MRLTKGMKKALSMFLTGALVVTGASIPATQTKAASADTLYWEGELFAHGTATDSDWGAKATDTNMVKGQGRVVDYSTWAGGTAGQWCGANISGQFDLTGFEKPTFKITYNNESDKEISKGIEVWFSGEENAPKTYATAATGTALTVEYDVPVTEDIDMQTLGVAPKAKSKVTITKIEIYDAAYTGGGEAPAGKSFHATLQYLDPSWATQEDTVEVTKDGDYTLTTWAGENAESTINMGWIETDLKNGDVSEDFKMTIKSIQLGTKLYTFSKADERYLGFKDQTAVTEDGEMGTYRLNIKNDYNALFDFADHQTKVKGTKANMFLGKDLITDEEYDAGMNAVNKGDVVQVKFTVEGFESEKAAKTYTQIADKDAEAEDTVNAGEYGNVEYTVSTVENIANPDASVAPSQTPATSVAPSQTPAASVQPSQKPVASVQPSQKPAASVQPSQKPVVKKDTKKTTKNACTKVKAKKAKVTVKKGKKATLKFTVTAKNKKAKTTDKMKVSVKNKKIVTVSKKKLSKGSATVTVKGKKKGSTKVTVKIGKKSAKVTVKVK